MKTFIVILALIVSGFCLGQQIDSVYVFTPDGKKVYSAKDDKIRLVLTKLDSLNAVYKTNHFDLFFFLDNKTIYRKCYERQKTLIQRDTI